MAKPDVWIENGFVEVHDRRVVEVGRAAPHGSYVDHGTGVIMPALVNAHAHLSLSVLEGTMSARTGFLPWVQELIRRRAEQSEAATARAAAKAARFARESGTGFLVEIGPVEPGMTAMREAGLQGLLGVEVLGNEPDVPVLPDAPCRPSVSFAGHALHTTAPQVLQVLCDAARARNSLFSIHLGESDDEQEFLVEGAGPWADFLRLRGIPFDHWDLRGETPVTRAHRLGLLGAGTLAVHVLHATSSEMATLAETGTAVCVCPRSNRQLHGRLPDIESLRTAGVTVALGTDSLASVPSLSLFDEMAFTAASFGNLRPETVLSMATVEGAGAVGWNDGGSLIPGSQSLPMYVALEARSPQTAAAALVSGDLARVEWI
jgi:aminodeoxyfutalosine deaminase